MSHKDRRIFDCPACMGDGNRYDNHAGHLDYYYGACMRCDGTGKIEPEPREEADLDCEEDDGLPLGDLPLTELQERTLYHMEEEKQDELSLEI